MQDAKRPAVELNAWAIPWVRDSSAAEPTLRRAVPHSGTGLLELELPKVLRAGIIIRLGYHWRRTTQTYLAVLSSFPSDNPHHDYGNARDAGEYSQTNW